ncbi:MAG: hypothetical protein K9L76_00140 [Candidatus Omnitrophica bacterium]|nr:hypothetical protein [Candidatus Omnitrophota bacterium]
MAKIILISCVSKKKPHKAKAKNLYMSTWFKYAFQYALSLKPDKIFILSAKYGLLNPERVIMPYNRTLNNMKSDQIKKWANNVVSMLKEKADLENDNFIILAGKNYRRYLIPYISNYKIPMKELSIGYQLNFLKKHT